MLLLDIGRLNLDTLATDTYRATDGRRYIDPSAPGPYLGRLDKPPTVRRTAFGPGQAGGVIQADRGSIILGDQDAALDGWGAYSVDGQSFTLRYIASETADFSTAVTVLTGTMGGKVPTGNTLVIECRDRLKTLDTLPLLPALYAGDNVPPYGLEGDASLKGRPKPLGLARVWNANITAHQANRSLGVFMVSVRAFTVSMLMVQGVPITAGGTYTLAQILDPTVLPSAGTWRVYSGAEGTWVKIRASDVAGIITVHGYYGSTNADRTLAQMVKNAVLGPGGFVAGDVYAADVTALDTALPYECCHWADQPGSVLQQINAWAAGAGVAVFLDRLDRLRMKLLTDPAAGTSVATFRMARGISPQGDAYDGTLKTGELDLLDLAPMQVSADQLLPAYRLDAGHTPVSSPVTDADLAGDRTIAADPVGGPAMRDFLALALRTTTSRDATILTQHPLARVMRLDSVFNFASLSTAAQVISVVPNALGSLYATAPTAAAGAPGAGCTITPRINGITSYTVGAGGSGFFGTPPEVTITSASGTRAAAIAITNAAGAVVAVLPTDPGYGYAAATVAFVHPTGSGATASAVIGAGKVTSYDVTAGGTGFTSVPAITLDNTGTGGSGASATAAIALFAITIDTAAAQAWADARRAIAGATSQWFQGKAWLSPDLVDAIELMDCVTLDWPRFGLIGGSKFLVLGDAIGARNDQAGTPVAASDLTFWRLADE